MSFLLWFVLRHGVCACGWKVFCSDMMFVFVHAVGTCCALLIFIEYLCFVYKFCVHGFSECMKWKLFE